MSALFLIAGESNAVNLTDGIDGLAAGLFAISAIGMAMALIHSPYTNQALALVCISMSGACCGFLSQNGHPAKVRASPLFVSPISQVEEVGVHHQLIHIVPLTFFVPLVVVGNFPSLFTWSLGWNFIDFHGRYRFSCLRCVPFFCCRVHRGHFPISFPDDGLQTRNFCFVRGSSKQSATCLCIQLHAMADCFCLET